jgi:hypothetical protein
MAIPHSVFTLRRKRNEIRDAIAAYEAKLREARADLAHVLATLRLFEANGSPADFPAYIDLNRVFRRGETTEFCLATLKAEGPLDTRELTERLMRAKGLDASDKVISQAVSLRIVQTLRIRAKRRKGIDGSLRRRGVCVWRLTSEGGAASTLSIAGKSDAARLTVQSEQTARHSTRADDFRAIPFQPHTRQGKLS